MGKVYFDGREFASQWASDVNFNGIRFEVLTAQGDVLFDVSLPDSGPISVNTFSNDVPADLVASAVAVARERQ